MLKPGQYTILVFARYVDERDKTRLDEVNLDLSISAENCVISHNRSGMVAPVLDWKTVG
jgi:hypothetical protein